jgi:hypothetical protein
MLPPKRDCALAGTTAASINTSPSISAAAFLLIEIISCPPLYYFGRGKAARQ